MHLTAGVVAPSIGGARAADGHVEVQAVAAEARNWCGQRKRATGAARESKAAGAQLWPFCSPSPRRFTFAERHPELARY